MKKSRILAAVLVAGTMAVTAIGAAQADPQGAPTFRELAGPGSDTTEIVMNNMAEAITIGGIKVLGSYDATGSATISPKAAANCQNLSRPNGSSAGRGALIKALKSTDATFGCYDWSRSSSLNTTSTGAGQAQLTYVPFAFDDLGFAVTKSSVIPKDLTKAELIAIYNCEVDGITALIPQLGSGTRGSWMSYVTLTEAEVVDGAHACVKDAVNGAPVQEHNGIVLNDTSITPYSVGKWQLQSTNSIADVTGRSVLGKINGGLAAVPSPDFDGKRAVYNIIPTAKEGTAPYTTVFVGPNSLVCQNTAIITAAGFATNPNCGSIATKTAP